MCRGYGSIPARVTFVGISAGRLGALKTSVPFTKDASGRIFQRCLNRLGLSESDEFSTAPVLKDCYITNLVKGQCLTNDGLNRLPEDGEIAFWWPHFQTEVERVQPKGILCLGSLVFQTIKPTYPVQARKLKHPRWYQAHCALSKDSAWFNSMVFDYLQDVAEFFPERCVG